MANKDAAAVVVTVLFLVKTAKTLLSLIILFGTIHYTSVLLSLIYHLVSGASALNNGTILRPVFHL